MSQKWTIDQELAINKEGTNIIVSAGAGSGKTAVLTTRIIRKIKEGVSFNNLLVLTFTNAAAKEMKERVRSLCKKEKLTKALEEIEASYITTFDSYALSIVKKYHYLLNINPEVKIGDSSIFSLEKQRIIDEIFENYYGQNNPLFNKLINELTFKDDSELKSLILTVISKLSLKANLNDYLNSYFSNYYNEVKINNDINAYLNLLESKRDTIISLIDEMSDYADSDYIDKFNESINYLISAKKYNDYLIAKDIKLPSLPKGSDSAFKLIKEEIGNLIKEISKLCLYEDEKALKESINSTKEYNQIIIEIIKEFNYKLNSYKSNFDIYEFNDIALMAIKILEENIAIREELKASLNEILVDEYQDTNDLQEYFINLIANNNVYMVGDIKQSIYRFRNANPIIFKEKYDLYKNNNGGFKIDLNKNFRSREEVINAINTIFNNLMNDKIGGASYKEEHQMTYGNLSYDEIKELNQDYLLNIYNYNYDKELGFTKEEIEIFIIANDIKNKINNKYQIYDKDTKKLRNASYNDFCILIDRGTSFPLYKKIFTYLNIPINVFQDEKLTESYDIIVIKNLLKLLRLVKNNSYDGEFKYLFVSVMRSFLMSSSDDAIFAYLQDNNFYQSELIRKLSSMIKKTEHASIYEVINTLLKEFQYYEKIITIGNVKESIARVDYLLDLSNSLAALNYSIDDFIIYLDNIFKSDLEIVYPSSTIGGNAVNLMTIHKSKGLEFNVCYFAGLYKEFNKQELKEKVLYDKDLGIITPYYKEGIGSTIYKLLLKEKYNNEEISEKIRLWYVALTRTKEKMIMIMPFKEEIKGNIQSSNSFSSFIEHIKSNITQFITNYDINKLNLTSDYNLVKKTNYESIIPTSNAKITLLDLKIETELLNKNIYSKAVNELLTFDAYNNINYGNKLHQALELLDFKNPNLDLIDEDIKGKVKMLLESELFTSINQAKIYQEYSFVDEDDTQGQIDLMLEFADHIKVIDYKTSNIDNPNYQNQVKGYMKYIRSKTNKKIQGYLYSVTSGKYLEIN